MNFVKHIILLTVFLQAGFSYAQKIYVSPNGDDGNDGLSKETPLKRIIMAVNKAKPGEEILLLPGSYNQLTEINSVDGEVDNPIYIKSESSDPDSFAVIDRNAEPSAESDKNAFRINNSSWIVIENIKFRNCWTDIIIIEESSYISIIGCDFVGGKRVIKPSGKGSHHFLVENCNWEQHEGVWSSFDWTEMHHGSQSYYNGSLFHPDNTDGVYVIRNNVVKNVFNAFRTDFDSQLDSDANGEFYNNIIENSRDNVFEPEGSAFNLHFYHNQIHNSHKPFSIDDLKGGPLYIYGNVITQDGDEYTKSLTTGIWKFKNGPLSEPCYVFNNSFYTKAKAFKEGEATNQQMKHFNNAYFFFEGSDRLRLRDWHSSFEFDYDCINQGWPANITDNNQEQNGIIADAKFVNGPGRDLKLQNDSPCIDAGKTMSIEELEWTQSFDGLAPDIGAYDNNKLIDGPPFRYFEPPGWSKTFEEKPRIVRHKIIEDQLKLYFSYPIDQSSLIPDAIKLFESGVQISITSAGFINNNYELIIQADQTLSSESLSLYFDPKPIGTNNEPVTYWASTIDITKNQVVTNVDDYLQTNKSKEGNDISVYPNPFNAQAKVIINLREEDVKKVNKNNPLLLYDIKGELVKAFYGEISSSSFTFNISSNDLPTGVYFAVFQINKEILSQKILLLK